MNWVDRRFSRDRNFGQAIELWNNSTAALHDAVGSYNKNGEYGEARIIPQNGHRVLIEVEHHEYETSLSVADPRRFLADPKRRVVVAFDGAEPAITVSLDADPTKKFQIEADETHCFLKYGGAEITFDEFSRLALEDAFFKPKSAAPARQTPLPQSRIALRRARSS